MRRAVERRIEDATSEETAASQGRLEPSPDVVIDEGEVVDDGLRVISQEGDVAVIRDLAPERVAPTHPASEQVSPLDVGALRVPDGATQTRYRMLVSGLVASDVLCLNLVLSATSLLDDIVAARSLGQFSWLLAIVGTLAWVAIFHAFGLYASRHLSSPEEIRRVIGATSVGAALLMIFGAGSLSTGTSARLGFAFLTLVVLEVVSRLAWRRYARSLRQKGLLAYRTIVIGSAHDAAAVSRAMIDDERSGFFPIGRVAHEQGTDAPGSPHFLGAIRDLGAVVREWSAEAIVVASPVLSVADLGAVQQLSRREHLALRLVARVPHMLTHRLTLQPVGSLMTVSVRPAELSGNQAALKRGFDMVVGSLALLISLPIQLVIGLAIALTSPGPVLFRQKRVTKDNRAFTVYKFRTMVHGADRDMDARGVDRTQPFFKGGDAPPITGVGKVLRALSLDELPQLWNVVRGDMSLVGPRPLPAEQVEANPELLGPRHEVRAGLTGWWQVNGRSDVSPEEAINQDLFYIENWSLSLDLYIILRTIGVLLFRRGAR
jgi:exopolysaccharide biosynthesis polyprenyl glycosylphosphotransferase